MKRSIIRIISLGLSLLLCAGVAAAQDTDSITYTMSEKLMKQLQAGSGFVGTLTLDVTANEGHEADAYSTIKPLVLDWTFIKVLGGANTGVPGEMRLKLMLEASEYQQGSVEVSLQDDAMYLQSSLLDEGWYLAGEDVLQQMLTGAGVGDVIPGASALAQIEGVLPGMMAFFSGASPYLLGADTRALNDAMADYTAGIDFWLEGYRDSVYMNALDDGTSIMEIGYRIPADDVKEEIKALVIQLMKDETMLPLLQAMMPAGMSALYLEPELQPYYFYTVNELPLEDDLVVNRVVSFLGDTVEMTVTMPLYDSVSGPMTLTYTYKLSAEDMTYDNTFTLTGEDGYASLSYRADETETGESVISGTVFIQGAAEDSATPDPLWADFTLLSKTVTTKDLNGYEKENQSLKLSITPAVDSLADGTENSASFSPVELSLTMSFASLAARSAPTDVDIKLTVSGEGMSQDIALEIAGSTTANWTPEAFDTAQAIDLAAMPADALQSLMSQAVVKGGLLVLPYINLPQVTAAPVE